MRRPAGGPPGRRQTWGAGSPRDGPRAPRRIVRYKANGPPGAAGRAVLRSDRPVALDLGEDLLEDDLPPGDELAAGPVAAIGRKPGAERVRAGGGQDYRVDRARANR